MLISEEIINYGCKDSSTLLTEVDNVNSRVLPVERATSLHYNLCRESQGCKSLGAFQLLESTSASRSKSSDSPQRQCTFFKRVLALIESVNVVHVSILNEMHAV